MRTPGLVRLSAAVFGTFLLVGEALAARSPRLDFNLDQWGIATSCAADTVAGSSVEFGAFTLSGYNAIFSSPGSDVESVDCQYAFDLDPDFDPDVTTNPFYADPEIAAIIGAGETVDGVRYSFHTEENIFDVFLGQGSSIYQWGLFYFSDAIIAALFGPVTYNESGEPSDLPLSGETTYLLNDGNELLTHGNPADGPQFVDFTTNYLCFSADGSTFNGAHSGADLSQCRSGGGGGTEVPLPGTLGLLGVGLAALGLVRRRQRS